MLRVMKYQFKDLIVMQIGSIIKNTIIYIAIMAIAAYIAFQYFLYGALRDIIAYNNDQRLINLYNQGLVNLFIAILILATGFGIAQNVSLPSIVSDDLIEF